MQRAVGDDDQPFVAKLSGNGSEDCLAQFSGGGGQFRIRFTDALLSLRSGLAAFIGAARRQKFVDLARAFLNQLHSRQFIAGQGISRDRPEVAALLADRAQRIFEQQRVGVELCLNLFELERLRLGERGVMRAGRAG